MRTVNKSATIRYLELLDRVEKEAVPLDSTLSDSITESTRREVVEECRALGKAEVSAIEQACTERIYCSSRARLAIARRRWCKKWSEAH
jgi:hypothetical protein